MSNVLPEARRPPKPFPITILTGFLGAGKTTLLNHLLGDPALKDTLVLINEFGEIGLDHLLVESVDGDMMLMASGCLCCTIRGDLVSALEDILRRSDNHRMQPFARVIIETTGLADPAPVLQAIMGHPYLTLRYRLDGIVTLVDAINGLTTIAAYQEARRQIAVADRLVLTKTDIVDDASALQDLLSAIKNLNPAAPVLDAAKMHATAQALLSVGLFDANAKIPDVARWLRAEIFDEAQKSQRQSNCAHDHKHHDVPNRHKDAIHAFAIIREKSLPPRAFELFLDLLRHAHGPKLLRVKGIVALADDPDRPIVIHGVQHLFHPAARLAGWPDADRRTRIVFIVDGIDQNFIEGLFSSAMGAIQPDQPDIAALTENPLAPPAGGLLSAS